MRAVLVGELGGPQVLVAAELPGPVAGPGEVVIEVSHVDIGFVETRIRSGGTIEARSPGGKVPLSAEA
ncbi:hypothetical protein ACFVYE_29345 [Streptomyces sp. NPDC058239]|uniref:hypothetical protein n=1 Tax=unclassified Streptomyces TaxID=2593676 RepID=UPI003662281C